MAARGYKISNKEGIHKEYRDILLESLRYCQKYKGLQIYSWYILNNHVHLVVAAATSEILKDGSKQEQEQAVSVLASGQSAESVVRSRVHTTKA